MGYQIYRGGKFNSERILGVLTRYGLDAANNSTVFYNTLGPNTSGWFGSWTYIHP